MTAWTFNKTFGGVRENVPARDAQYRKDVRMNEDAKEDSKGGGWKFWTSLWSTVEQGKGHLPARRGVAPGYQEYDECASEAGVLKPKPESYAEVQKRETCCKTAD